MAIHSRAIATVTVVLLIVGTLCFKYVEKPSRSFGRKVAQRTQQRTVAA